MFNEVVLRRSGCKGCKYEFQYHEILCPGCSRDKRDNYKPVKVVK